MNIKITLEKAWVGKVELDGVDISRSVAGVRFAAHPSERPYVELDILASPLELEGEAEKVYFHLRDHVTGEVTRWRVISDDPEKNP